ncbi:MAG: excisionase family DNA-binding protein [Candidatus Omnitrophica bacterium]|nr:excisionase family DNA-binding protein [Candidatus Omnitrophota bacterium]
MTKDPYTFRTGSSKIDDMKEPSIEERIRILRNIGFHPEKIDAELDANALIAEIEVLEKKLGAKDEIPIRQRVKRWRNIGWHPERIIAELRAQAKLLQVKYWEKEGKKRKGKDQDSDDLKFPMTTAQAAKHFGVTSQTLRRWLQKLKIETGKTDGGHFRINRAIFKDLKREFEKGSRHR